MKPFFLIKNKKSMSDINIENRKFFIIEEDVFRHNQNCLTTFGANNIAMLDRSYLQLQRNMKKFQSDMIVPDTITGQLEKYHDQIQSLEDNSDNNSRLRILPFIELKGGGRFSFIKTIKLTNRKKQSSILKLLSNGDEATSYILDVLVSDELKKLTKDYKEVVYVTKDRERRGYAKMIDINVQDYEYDVVPTDLIYSGHAPITMQTDLMTVCFEKRCIDAQQIKHLVPVPIPNNFYKFTDGQNTVPMFFDARQKKFLNIYSKIEKGGYSGYHPEGDGQKYLTYAMQQAFDIIALQGEAGTGKTYSAIYLALHKMKNNPDKYKKLYLVKPMATVNAFYMGAMPGDVDEKLDPYMSSLLNAIEDIKLYCVKHDKKMSGFITKLQKAGDIINLALPFVRGINIRNAILILDEAQNTTNSEMKAVLTRLGENSQAIVCGDIDQIDVNRRLSLSKGSSGFANLIYKLSQEPEFSHISCYKNFRLDIVKKITKLL